MIEYGKASEPLARLTPRRTKLLEMLTNLTQDFRVAARMLWRNRGFAASAMLILTIGIAASTGLFAVIDAVVLHPLPYAGADRIARVRLVTPKPQPRGEGRAASGVVSGNAVSQPLSETA